MSMFGKYASSVSAAALSTQALAQEEPKTDADVAVVPVIDGEPGDITDPLDGVDGAAAQLNRDAELEEQRQRRNADMGMESFGDLGQADPVQAETQDLSEDLAQEGVQKDEPVDGADDDLTIGKPDTDVELPEGETGEEPKITETGNDVKVDADDTEVDFDQEAELAQYQQVDQELDQFEADQLQMEQLDLEIGQLAESAIAIEQFGFNPTAAAIMQVTGLLNGTALESLGLESVNFAAPSEPESELALEALGEKIKEKAAQWSAKVLNVVKNSSDKLVGVVKPLWDKISGSVKTLTSRSWDKAKEAGKTVKAHPYQTAAAVVAAIFAVGTIVAFAGTGAPAPGAKIDVMRTYLNKLASSISKIKWPFGKIKASVSDNGMKLLTSVDGPKGVFSVADTKTVTEMGWSQSAVKALSAQLGRAWSSVQNGWAGLGTRVAKLALKAGEVGLDVVMGAADVSKVASNNAARAASRVFGTGRKGALASAVVGHQVSGAVGGAYIMAIIGVVMGMFRLARTIVVGGFRMIHATLKALFPLTAEEAAA